MLTLRRGWTGICLPPITTAVFFLVSTTLFLIGNNNNKVQALSSSSSSSSSSLSSSPTRFPADVFDWLKTENVVWTDTQIPNEWQAALTMTSSSDNDEKRSTNNVVVNLSDGSGGGGGNDDSEAKAKIILHLIPTPTSLDECLQCNTKKFLTDSMIQEKQRRQKDDDDTESSSSLPKKIVHLHEDVWIAKTSIVQHRLLAQLGRSQSRIFARKTISKRINATLAMDFLEEHHLWGATRAKYYYGLFLQKRNGGKNKNDEHDDREEETLVAVATFSSRRKIRRLDKAHRSHELLRFCARRDSTVVGGISKLIKAFVTDTSPDDIVTVVDRDWGDGSGWHTTGFETVHTMAPIVMAITPTEPGIRRHLVGAGIQSGSGDDVKENKSGRMGLPFEILSALEASSSSDESLRILSTHNFYPVYDSGVERLLKVVTDHSGVKQSATTLWEHSEPRYASCYYSENSGISCLLKQAEVDGESSNKKETKRGDNSHTKSWKTTSGKNATGDSELIFSAPSSMDPAASVEVRERADGWRTVGLVGGVTKSIYHAIYKVDKGSGKVEPKAVVAEHLRSMAALILAGFELKQQTGSSRQQQPLRVLHMGLGGGTLPRLLAHHVADIQQVAVELDQGVVAASQILPEHPRIRIVTGDAIGYQRDALEEPFDCVCIDVFDERNLLPEVFYASDFLHHIKMNLLAQDGFVVCNFHTGGKKRAAKFATARSSFENEFSFAYFVDSMDSKSHAGNAVLFASNVLHLEDNGIAKLEEAALNAQSKWDLCFGISDRVREERLL